MRRLEELGGPRGLPLAGNMLELASKSYHQTLEQWATKYGPLFLARAGRKSAIVVSDRGAVREVLRARPHAYRRMSNIQPVLAELQLDGLFSAEGQSWKGQRKLVQAAFAPKVVRAAFPRVREVSERLLKLWGAAADRGEVLDVGADLMRFTIDVTTIIAFGEDVNTLERGPSEFRTHLQHVLPVAFSRMFSPLPYWHYFKLPRDRAMELGLAAVREKIFAFIERAKANLEAHSERVEAPTNMLEALLCSRDADEPAKRLSDEQVLANAVGILLAGEDTTAHTITWMLHHVASDPEVQTRWQAEVDAKLGDATLLPSLSASTELPYIAGAVNETLRLRPPGPFLTMESLGEQVILDTKIPDGTVVVLMLRSVGTDPEAFSAPHYFNPARWIPAQEPARHTPAASLPFGFGPRICPGRSLGLLEATSVGAMVARNFTLDPVGGGEVHEAFTFTMAPRGVRMRLRRR